MKEKINIKFKKNEKQFNKNNRIFTGVYMKKKINKNNFFKCLRTNYISKHKHINIY